MKTIQDSDCDQHFAHTCSYLPKHPYRHTKVVTQVSADSIINLFGGRSLPFIPHTLINSLYNMCFENPSKFRRILYEQREPQQGEVNKAQ